MELTATLLVVGVAVTMVALYVLVIRRLLDFRTGFVRTAAVAVLALYLAPTLLQTMSRAAGLALLAPPAGDRQLGLRVLLLVLSVLAATVAAMVLLVLAELLVPTGTLPGPIELSRSWRARYRRMHRYLQIVRIAVRHGLGRFLRGQPRSATDSPGGRRELAHSLRLALEEGGVTFIKLGQLLSTRGDLLPAEFVTELGTLQDRATPMPWERIRDVLEREYGRPPDQVFAAIEQTPLAAASIGQVHGARLRTGEQVVVKVQRPDVHRVLDRDLDIIARLAGTVARRTRWGRSLGVRELAEGFATALREELDFTVERDNMRAVAAATSPPAGPTGPVAAIRVPVPYAPLCTSRVLVMERLDGVPLGTAGPLLADLGAELRRSMAGSLLAAVLGHMLQIGVFHADPHPGNVLIGRDGTIGLLDFGSVGRLDGTSREALGRLLLAIDRMDSLAASDALLELVDRPGEIDERRLERALGQILVRYASPGATVGAAAFTALFRLVTEAGLRVPAEIAGVFRAMATIEGTLGVMDPQFDVVDAARRLGRDRLGDVGVTRARRALEDELVTVLPLLRRLPRRVDRIADSIEHGQLTARVSLLADPADRRLVVGLLHQVLLTVLGATAGLMAVILLSSAGGPRLAPALGLYEVFGYGLLVIGIVLALRVLILIFQRE
jgi:ubiquinone biosynthesis protein